MPRFIDELRCPTTKIAMPAYVSTNRTEFWAETTGDMRNHLLRYDMPVIVADNVADYFERSVHNGARWPWKALPNLAPPYHLFWIEYRYRNVRTGVLFMDGDASQVLLSDKTNQTLQNFSDSHWTLTCIAFFDFGDGPTGPHGMTLSLNSSGQVVQAKQLMTFMEHYDDEERKYGIPIYPTWLTICFMHCKNIVIKDNAVDPPLAKKYKARHGVTPVSYKTLIIEPLKSILRREGRSQEVGLMKAIHICRGHFSDYRQGNGLFGKLHGEFWMPDMVRGTKGKALKAPQIVVLPPKIGF